MLCFNSFQLKIKTLYILKLKHQNKSKVYLCQEQKATYVITYFFWQFPTFIVISHFPAYSLFERIISNISQTLINMQFTPDYEGISYLFIIYPDFSLIADIPIILSFQNDSQLF